MRKEEIKNILIIHADNDFVRVWDWIGKVALMTIPNTNICGCNVLEDSEDIEKFIHSLIPTGIEFLQYREDKYADFCRYEDVSKEHVKWLSDEFSYISFHYNVKETDEEWKLGGCETLFIDLENNKSYIR